MTSPLKRDFGCLQGVVLTLLVAALFWWGLISLIRFIF